LDPVMDKLRSGSPESSVLEHVTNTAATVQMSRLHVSPLTFPAHVAKRVTSSSSVSQPSGAGKSSFIEAGIVPRLKEQSQWIILRVRPGRAPFETLANRLLPHRGSSLAHERLDASLASAGPTAAAGGIADP
jgi:hypothetical protein